MNLMVMYLFRVCLIFQAYHASQRLIKAVFLFTRTNVRILLKILSQRLCEILVLDITAQNTSQTAKHRESATQLITHNLRQTIN